MVEFRKSLSVNVYLSDINGQAMVGHESFSLLCVICDIAHQISFVNIDFGIQRFAECRVSRIYIDSHTGGFFLERKDLCLLFYSCSLISEF